MRKITFAFSAYSVSTSQSGASFGMLLEKQIAFRKIFDRRDDLHRLVPSTGRHAIDIMLRAMSLCAWYFGPPRSKEPAQISALSGSPAASGNKHVPRLRALVDLAAPVNSSSGAVFRRRSAARHRRPRAQMRGSRRDQITDWRAPCSVRPGLELAARRSFEP